MRSIRVSARDLLFVLSSRMPDTNHYLDTNTGEIIPVFAYNREKILEQVKTDPERYVRLAPISGRRGYEMMQQFTATVTRKEFRARLEAALAGERSFREFREVVHAEPAEYRRWKLFRLENMARPLREKLKQRGIGLELTDTDQPDNN